MESRFNKLSDRPDLGVGFQRRAADDVHRPPLAHGQVVRGIKGLGRKVACGGDQMRNG